MANEYSVWDETFAAAADFQSCQFCFVKVSVTPRWVALCSTSGEAMMGILQNNPLSGGNAVVRLLGRSKLVAGGAVTLNGLVKTGSSGQGLSVTLTSGEYVCAQAIETLASGEINEVIVRGAPVRAQ